MEFSKIVIPMGCILFWSSIILEGFLGLYKNFCNSVSKEHFKKILIEIICAIPEPTANGYSSH